MEHASAGRREECRSPIARDCVLLVGARRGVFVSGVKSRDLIPRSVPSSVRTC
jgi:hypothetical protein